MKNSDLIHLGDRIAQLRIARQLKQSELAYEAGVSERTLQRIEAGEVVKSDGLLKIIRKLGRIDELLSAIGTTTFSPYELAQKVTKGRRKKLPKSAASGALTSVKEAKERPGRGRVRHKRADKRKARANRSSSQTIVWPEDTK